jgi:threonine dehydratase
MKQNNLRGPESVSLWDIFEARVKIRGIASRTPLIYSPALSSEAGTQVYLKPENFQPVKVFKVRGAANRLVRLPKGASVIAASSGNHALALAYVTSLLGQKATVCVPHTAGRDKVMSIQAFGATVIVKGESYEDALEESLRLQRETGATFVHTSEDPYVIAGQGTIAPEILEDLPEVTSVVVPVGGGGLISGVSIGIKGLRGDVKVIGVQSENAPTLAHAFETGELAPPRLARTRADGLASKVATQSIVNVMKRNVDRMFTTTESAIDDAVFELLSKEHLLAEPSGAVGVAALRDHRLTGIAGEKVVVVISGGNVSLEYLSEILRRRTA